MVIPDDLDTEGLRLAAGSKDKCCGCSACAVICPRHAISMTDDEMGAAYAVIDKKACVDCGLCSRVCAFQAAPVPGGHPGRTYAAAARDEMILKNASSGGVFSVCAEKVLGSGGVVYGCAMRRGSGGVLAPVHIRIEEESGLRELAGSKYAQSRMDRVFKAVRSDLRKGRTVLFGGTPCQCEAVKSYFACVRLGEEERERLILIDIVCHGVPGTAFFEDYVRFLEEEEGLAVRELTFRDKKYGWGLKGHILYDGKEKVLNKELSSYYKLFLSGATYRDCCYACPYAGGTRPGDLTIGDYWGIEDEHPAFLAENGGPAPKSGGISVIVVNNKRGEQLLESLKDEFCLTESSFEKAAAHNGQLLHPTSRPAWRETVADLYGTGGYRAVDKWYLSELGSRKTKLQLLDKIPSPVKKTLKKILGKT